MEKIKKGQKGENLATEFLQKKGYLILERNWRYSKLGEIDIIAQQNNTIAFIEVKTRSTNLFGEPIEAITPSKIKKIYKLAEIYLNNQISSANLNYRFDAISVKLGQNTEIIHNENIYSEF